LHEQQQENPTKTGQPVVLQDRQGDMIQSLQSTLRVLQAERSRAAADAAKASQAAQGKKGDRESASPVEVKSPKTRRRKSKAG